MTYYDILDVQCTASDADIHSAYRKKALAHSPDRGGDATIFRVVRKAYETLSDPARRAAYDRQLAASTTSSGIAHSSGQCPAGDPLEAVRRIRDPRTLSVEETEAVCEDMLERAPPNLRGIGGVLLRAGLALKRRRQERP